MEGERPGRRPERHAGRGLPAVAGDLVPLEEQDRSRWHRGLIDQGVRLLTGTTTPYQLQAAIAACHATAPSPEQTDRRRIAVLYERLARLTPSPFIELDRALALAPTESERRYLRRRVAEVRG